MMCHSLKKEEKKTTVTKTGHKNQDRKAVFHRVPQSHNTPSSGSSGDQKAFLEQSIVEMNGGAQTDDMFFCWTGQTYQV